MLVFLGIFMQVFGGISALSSCNEPVDALKLCTNHHQYDRGASPMYQLSKTKQPTPIGSSLTILAVSEFSEDEGTVTLELLISVWWNDSRLSLKSAENDSSELFWYPITDSDLLEIFNPVMKIDSLSGMIKQERYGPIDKDYYWFSMPHMLEIQQNYRVTIYCNFNFEKFPFDSQECDLRIGSFANANYDVIMVPAWIRDDDRSVAFYGDPPLLIHQSRQPFEIYVQVLETIDKPIVNYNYSFTGAKFTFERNNLGLLVIGFYVPTGIFAVLSLISFSIDNETVIEFKKRQPIYIKGSKMVSC